MNTRSVALCFNDNAEHIVFQVNPAQLSLSRPNRNQSFDLALGGSINLWGGRGLRQVRYTKRRLLIFLLLSYLLHLRRRKIPPSLLMNFSIINLILRQYPQALLDRKV